MGVSLTKRQSVSLSKASNQLTSIDVGLGWDPIKKSKGLLGSLFGGGGSDSIDLDASCVLIDAQGKVVDTVWFRQLSSNCKSVIHSGDNLTGEGDGDDETIKVDLTKLPANVEHLAFTVNSFRGQTFNEVENAFVRVVDNKKSELAKFNLNEKGSHTGVLIASLRRNGGDWTFTARGLACKGRTVAEMHPQIIQEIM